MASVGNTCYGSVFIAPLENDAFLKKIKKSTCNCLMGFNNSSKSNKICCGLPENPTSSRPSISKNTVEEYNTAMKKMMRNPYEYHHDLGQSRNLLSVISGCISFFYHLMILQFVTFCGVFSIF